MPSPDICLHVQRKPALLNAAPPLRRGKRVSFEKDPRITLDEYIIDWIFSQNFSWDVSGRRKTGFSRRAPISEFRDALLERECKSCISKGIP
jgi:hypothetical protein